MFHPVLDVSGDVGEGWHCFNKMAAGIGRLEQIEDDVEQDVMRRSIKEPSTVCADMFRAAGAKFEQEHLRFISMVTGAGSTVGASGPQYKQVRRIIEHKVIQN